MNLKLFLSIFLIFLIGSVSAATLAQWPLTSSGVATNVDANVNAGDFVAGSGINGNVGEGIIVGNFAITSAGASATNWSTSTLDTNKYFQISLSPKSGFSLNVNSINFGQSRNMNGIKNYDVQWSKDLSFSSPTTIAMVTVPLDDHGHVSDITGLNINVSDGETLYIRWFGYNSVTSAGVWSIYKTAPNNGGIDDSLSIGGTTNKVTTPQTPTLEQKINELENKTASLELRVNQLENRTTALESLVNKIIKFIKKLPKGLRRDWN